MPRLLLLLPATTYRGDAFLEAARGLDLDITIGFDGTGPIQPAQAPHGLPLDFRNPEASALSAEQFSREHPIDAVIGVDDVTAELAAMIAARLGLPHNPPHAVTAARNKYMMRKALAAHDIPIPDYQLYSRDDDPVSLTQRVTFPCVVKPTILSASCGVIRADDPESFVQAFQRVARLLETLGLDAMGDQSREILVEEFIPGPEVALEGLLIDSTLRLLAIFDKPNPLDGPFFEETMYVTPSRLPARTQRDIEACAASAAAALGLREGPIHCELRINDRGVWVIELAARSIGGQCSKTLRFAAGMSLEELILRQLLRMDIESVESNSGSQSRAAGVMMLPIPCSGVLGEIRGQEEALAVSHIEELTITAKAGDRLVPLPEGTRYLGFLFARAGSPDVVEQALREAHQHLQVVIRVDPAKDQPPDIRRDTEEAGRKEGLRVLRF